MGEKEMKIETIVGELQDLESGLCKIILDI